jgi:hypothetical protein
MVCKPLQSKGCWAVGVHVVISASAQEFGAKLEFITNKSQEGAQFCKGFGGIGGILRWKVDFMTLADHETREALAASRAARTAEGARGASGAGSGTADYEGDGAAGGAGGFDEEGGFGEENEDAPTPTQTRFEEEIDFM